MSDPRDSDFCDDTLHVLLAGEILNEPPLPLGTDAFIARIAPDDGPEASEVMEFLRRRLDREP